VTPASPPSAAPWRADLTALERQLRTEFHATTPGAASSVPVALSAGRAAAGDMDLVRRLKVMIDDSERRQERELALRIAELMRDVDSQRRADLRKIDENLGLIEGRTGVEVIKNREMVNYLLQRVSQRQ
jgi:hypothetical protein